MSGAAGAAVGTLVLTRKVGESICIGEDITVSITDISSGQVRLAITAPRSVPVHRHEVLAEIAAANAAAATAPHGQRPALPRPPRGR